MKHIESVEMTPLSISDEILKEMPDCQFYTSEYDALKNEADILNARLQKLGKSSQTTLWGGTVKVSYQTIQNHEFRLFPRSNHVCPILYGFEALQALNCLRRWLY